MSTAYRHFCLSTKSSSMARALPSFSCEPVVSMRRTMRAIASLPTSKRSAMCCIVERSRVSFAFSVKTLANVWLSEVVCYDPNDLVVKAIELVDLTLPHTKLAECPEAAVTFWSASPGHAPMPTWRNQHGCLATL